ncbi:MAG: CoA transferase [Bacillota bacterium]|nr:CoA transferase [Bacillota bacterium]
MNMPLSGIRILDLSRYLPGPLCTQLLADFGAEVIKLEDPKGGELGRHLPPFIGSESSPFLSVNRNKKSITLDLKTPEGKKIFKELAQESDVVLDQFRPGVMDKMGVGYETLKEINPKLIYCSLTGYGLDGPLKNTAGHDLNYLNLAGITGLNGKHHDAPSLSAIPIADTAGGSLFSAIAILLAIISRLNTGKGQLCDVAMMDGSIALLAYTLGEWSGCGQLPERGNELLTGGYACYRIYETSDSQYVSLGAIEGKFWAEFCEKLERKQYIPLQLDKASQESISEDISTIILTKTRDEWVAFFADSNICFTPVLNLEEMSEHPQVLARNMVLNAPNINGSGIDLRVPGVPIKLSDTPGKAELCFPQLGEHTDPLLLKMGYTQEEINNFRNQGII